MDEDAEFVADIEDAADRADGRDGGEDEAARMP